jgi:hypothetical protein
MIETDVFLMIPGVKKYFIKAIVTPENASKRLVRWDSDKKSVATIDRHTGELTIQGAGVANITATTVDGGLKATCRVRITEMLLKNPSFEDPDDNSITLKDWEKVPQEWFAEYYTENAGNDVNLDNVDRQRGSTFANADFFREANAVDGKYVARVAGNTTGGIYQIIAVKPGCTYSYKVIVGFRRNTDNMSIKDETVKILSVDGLTLFLEKPINVDKSIEVGLGTIEVVTGEFIAPEDVTEVRFQFDQRTFDTPDRAPLMLIDNCQFLEL